MGSRIEYVDEGWPLVTGCSPVEDGCHNCFAARLAATRLRHHPAYEGLAQRQPDGSYRYNGEVRTHPELLDRPYRWSKPRRVFVGPTGDLYHLRVPQGFILDAYEVMQLCRQHTFIVVTKRGTHIKRLLYDGSASAFAGGDYLPNVWHLFSASGPQTAGWAMRAIRDLKDKSDGWPVLGISLEPYLEPVDLRMLVKEFGVRPDWIIVGGETAPMRLARPMDRIALEVLLQQAHSYGIPVFVKQAGTKLAAEMKLRDRRGADPREWPCIWVREWPEVGR